MYDLSNKVFGRLKTISPGRNNKNKKTWICKCVCGKIVNILTDHLMSGHTRSCGCNRGSKGRKKPDGFGKIISQRRMERKRKLGYINSIETRKKIGLAGIGRVQSEEKREKHSIANRGERSPHWEGGITKLSTAIRRTYKYRLWRTAIFERDNYTCQDCKKRGVFLHADHIKSFSKILHDNNIKTVEQALLCEEFWNKENGRTLCMDCHKKTDTYPKNLKVNKKIK